jgi:hypothetical protein
MDINKGFELLRNGKLHECSIRELREMSAGSFVWIQNHFPDAAVFKAAVDDEIRRKEAADAEQREAARHRERVAIEIRELNVGDNYTAGQVGAMGPHAHAHDISMNQVSANELAQIDMRTLSTELATLRHEMRRTAVEPEHDVAVGQIAAAEIAARRLKNASKWAVDVATKIGVNVASEAMKKSMGM